MLLFIQLAEAVKVFVEHIPTLALLVGVPIAIIALAFIATAIATFIDQQLPAHKPSEPSLGQENPRR